MLINSQISHNLTQKYMESTNNSFIKEESKASDEESRCVDHHLLLLQVGALKGAGDIGTHGATRKQAIRDKMKATSHDLKNFMDCGGDQGDHGPTGTKIERSSPDQSDSRSSSSSAKRKKMDYQLIGSSKAELDEVMEENQRLKTYLDRILKDYRTLQMQYQDVVHQEEAAKRPHVRDPEEPNELFALSLGRSSPSDRTKDEPKPPPRHEHADQAEDREGLALGLDCKFRVPNNKKSTVEASPNHSPENSVDVEAKEDGGETWQPKTERDNARESGEIDEITQQNPVKRARVSVRVRCDTPTMNDGCQWRKYGQKISKGNPCPRAYYRCTVAPSCPVRKQVQRCAEDMSILITTYEGTHSHPLPISATAMASTTSAAASMLMTGSSNSTSGLGTSSTTPAGSENLNGLNFYLSDNNNSRSKPFYLPNSSISSNPSFPTITLDLTSTSASSTMSSHLSRLASIPPRQYSTTNLNFSSLESNPLPISWSNGMLNYGSQPLNKNQTTSSSLSFGAQPYDQTLYQSYLQKNMTNSSQQSVNPDTIAAATKAITSDPSFQSALAAALSSIIGGSSGGTNASGYLPNQNEGEPSSQQNNVKTSEPFPILSSFPSSSSSNTNKCAPSYMNRPSSTTSSSPADGMMFLSPPFSNTKSRNSNSPGDHNRDHAA